CLPTGVKLRAGGILRITIAASPTVTVEATTTTKGGNRDQQIIAIPNRRARQQHPSSASRFHSRSPDERTEVDRADARGPAAQAVAGFGRSRRGAAGATHLHDARSACR